LGVDVARPTLIERMPETIVMVATSYPRFAGDIVGTFMEPIARAVAARGHAVHVVLPWHPALARPLTDGGVTLHPFRYAPHRSLNVFGYAGALKADVALRWQAWASAPLALAAGVAAARRIVRTVGATVVHGHWVVPGGAMAALAAAGRPLVVSLHGSDVYVAERHALAGAVARRTFARAGWVTACSADLRDRAIALGADARRSAIVPDGVDVDRFGERTVVGAVGRRRLGVAPDTPLVIAMGRFVSKKGFEYLIDAVPALAAAHPRVQIVIAGGGDLEPALRQRARDARVEDRVTFAGVIAHDEVPIALAAADVAVVPSVRDDAGNVDGLPNVVLEALASGTPVVATPAGGIGSAITDGENGLLVPERDPVALAAAIDRLLSAPALGARLGPAARSRVRRDHGWDGVARQFEAAYAAARRARLPALDAAD
jgi:glycosyltransferase involved in cell wall biosynthesis